VLTLLKTRDGKNYLPDVTGNWRVYHFVEDSVCLEKVESNEDFYQSALAFGHFVELLKDFPAEELTETIPDFHNTPKRFARLHAAVEADTCGRRAEVEEEIRFLFAREEEAGMLQRMLHLNAEEMPSYMDATDALGAAYCHFLQLGRPASPANYRGWKDFINKNRSRVSEGRNAGSDADNNT
jgi:hypothetical protein